MACNVQIPVDDIAEEVKQLLNLDQYVKQDNGTANNLTLKGGVTLDSATKQDLCEALANCFEDNYVGFTKWDAEEMTAIAQKIIRKQKLTDGEVAKSRNKMQKYWKRCEIGKMKSIT